MVLRKKKKWPPREDICLKQNTFLPFMIKPKLGLRGIERRGAWFGIPEGQRLILDNILGQGRETYYPESRYASRTKIKLR